MQSQLYNGARATISISRQIVAAAFVASYQIDTSASEIETIDNVFPVELAPDRIRVSMSLQVYRHPENDPIANKMAAGSGNLGSTEQKAFTEAKYISVDIKDDLDNTIFHIPKAWVVSRSGSMSAQDLIIESWSIRGIGYLGPQS